VLNIHSENVCIELDCSTDSITLKDLTHLHHQITRELSKLSRNFTIENGQQLMVSFNRQNRQQYTHILKTVL
jgi:hypothetical protein